MQLCALVLWLVATGLWFAYDGSRPVIPNPANGQIHALNTHGHVIYISIGDALKLYGLAGLGAAGLIAGIVMERRSAGSS